MNEALTSAWALTSASLILLTGQVGFTFLELAQTQKKNRDFIVMKNLMVFILALVTWFSIGYAVAFGTDAQASDPLFAGFSHGWFGNLDGGLSTEGDGKVAQSVLDETILFNQRRFFVFFAFQVLSSNIATSSIAERAQLPALLGFVFFQ